MDNLALLAAVAGALLLTACGGGGGDAAAPPTVYAVGWALENESIAAPVYWTSETPTVLSRIDLACDGRAYGIALADADVHIAGYTSRCSPASAYSTTAAWWNNGQRLDLPKPNDFHSVASDIAIAGGSVYIAGAVSSGDGYLPVPIYWKDGAPNPLALPSDTDSGIAQAIAVSGQDVYVTALLRAADRFIVGYYKNGVLIRLPLPPGAGFVGDHYRITLSGGDVYVTGSLLLPADPGAANGRTRMAAVYWKDGALVQLSSDIQVDDVVASGFALDDGHVYVAGWRRDSTTFVSAPMLWTDNVANVLVSGDLNVKAAVALGVAIALGDTYVPGYAYDPNVSAYGAACYWVNGVRFLLKGLGYAGAPFDPALHDPHLALFVPPSPLQVTSVAAVWSSFAKGIPRVGGPHFAPLTLPFATPMANSGASAIAVRR